MQTRTILLFVAAVFLVIGCTSQLQNISECIDLSYQTGPNIQHNEEVEVRISNQTKHCIVFPIDFGVKVFINQNGEWKQVSNLVTYISDRPERLEPKGDIFSETIVLIRPDISNLIVTEQIDSYALITGHLCDDEEYVVEKKIPFVITP